MTMMMTTFLMCVRVRFPVCRVVGNSI
jgi:hypothetical protein